MNKLLFTAIILLSFLAFNVITADDQVDSYRIRPTQINCCGGLSFWIIVLIVVGVIVCLILVAGALLFFFKVCRGSRRFRAPNDVRQSAAFQEKQYTALNGRPIAGLIALLVRAWNWFPWKLAGKWSKPISAQFFRMSNDSRRVCPRQAWKSACHYQQRKQICRQEGCLGCRLRIMRANQY